MYLYFDGEEWIVGDTPGSKRGALRHTTSRNTTEVPTNGWMYFDQTLDSFQNDPTLTINPGPLPPLPRKFIVTASGAAAEKWPSMFGVFTRTERWWLGRPVYINSRGRLLHHGALTDGWMIGGELGLWYLRGSRSYHSPASERSWLYWTGIGTEGKPASVTVIGSD